MHSNQATKTLQGALSNLRNPIVVADLGSSGNAASPLPEWFAQFITSISIDALTPDQTNRDIFSENIVVKGLAISDAIGKETFIERQFSMCSGLNEVHNEEVTKYGIEQFYQEVKRIEISTTTLSEILKKNKLSNIHYLKLDLEGSDLAVLDSCIDYLQECSLLQIELRNEPLYVGEKNLGESLMHLNSLGFQLIDMKNEYWKRKTPNWQLISHGNLAYSDAIFTRRFNPKSDAEIVRYVLLMHFYGYTNLAEYWLNTQNLENMLLRIALLQILFERKSLPLQAFNHPYFPHLALAHT